MSIYADQNVICSMLYQRGERLATPGLKTVSRRQIENVVEKYCQRENRFTPTSREIMNCSTDRWTVEPTQLGDRFLISQLQPK